MSFVVCFSRDGEDGRGKLMGSEKVAFLRVALSIDLTAGWIFVSSSLFR